MKAFTARYRVVHKDILKKAKQLNIASFFNKSSAFLPKMYLPPSITMTNFSQQSQLYSGYTKINMHVCMLIIMFLMPYSLNLILRHVLNSYTAVYRFECVRDRIPAIGEGLLYY